MASSGFFLIPTPNSAPAWRVVELGLGPTMELDAEDGGSSSSSRQQPNARHRRRGGQWSWASVWRRSSTQRRGGSSLSSSSSRTTGTDGGLEAREAKGAVGGAYLEQEGVGGCVWMCGAGTAACGGTARGTGAARQERHASGVGVGEGAIAEVCRGVRAGQRSHAPTAWSSIGCCDSGRRPVQV
jgi:hypothetical protein